MSTLVQENVEGEQELRGGVEPEKSGSPPSEPRSHKAFLLGLLGLFIILAIIGVLPRLRGKGILGSTPAPSIGDGTPVVTVTKPQQPAESSELVLPGTTQAIEEAMIAARTGGYVVRRYVDIGDRVRQGQVLAEIDTPEIDQQVQQAKQEEVQARADAQRVQGELEQTRQGLEQAQANLKQAQAAFNQTRTRAELASVELRRSKALVSQGVVPQQETEQLQAGFDVSQADIEVAQANISERQANIKGARAAIAAKQSNYNSLIAVIAARRANVERLEQLQAFKHVTAPFDGVITARNVDVGSLVGTNGQANSTNANASAGLFKIARLESIRTYVNVPQTYMSNITPGMEAEVQVKELPQEKFVGRVIRTSNALDPASRTLLTEVILPNPEGRLVTGMYVQVHFSLTGATQGVMIPANALMVNSDGAQVVTLGADRKVHFQKVAVGRDFGKEILIVSGINLEQQIITNPSDSLREGMSVRISETKNN